MIPHHRIVVICPLTRRWLCNDNQWRRTHMIGDQPRQVKTFRYARAAMKAGERYRIKPADPGDTVSSIKHLYHQDTIDPDGNVVRLRD